MFDANVVREGLGQAEQDWRQAAAGVHGSPDGLGAAAPVGEYFANPQGTGAYTVEPGQRPRPQYAQPVAGQEFDFIEPDDTSSGAATRSAGFTLLFVAVSTGIGFALRGGLGAAAGLALSAGVANGYRAQKWWDSPEPSEKHEAVVSGIFAAAEVVSGLYVGYKAFQLPKDR